uniref:Rab-GAP TBC domain-containing protein n=1 Tax=Musa acuminata subsp. malaccensis TaxID=214687 RepID=A0A804KTI5_MUSAM|nr:PREDICTED: TBC1 domain family member 8B-like [Musa acuminata subsp. malaccensis]XP_009420345.1 PREDICTED: TBC1 domain family member 8B-like [Musa acuminata subsp. malaccensis]
MKGKSLPIITFEHKRDAYGFAVRPQHLQRYREYANIYKEEEEERSERWKKFLERLAEFESTPNNDLSTGENKTEAHLEAAEVPEKDSSPDELSECDGKEEVGSGKETTENHRGVHQAQIWAQIRPSLSAIEQMMSHRVKKKKFMEGGEQVAQRSRTNLAPIEESRASEDSDDEFYDVERSEPVHEASSGDEGNFDSNMNMASQGIPEETKEELECLVRGGLPMALRGELWQAFVGVGARRIDGYYSNLLGLESMTDAKEVDAPLKAGSENKPIRPLGTEKWKGQIEKDLPRTFPGHPALDEDGRNALRRLLTAYARHNPSVGYCQAMNFFAGLLLLLMPEENAFWTLMGIIDDYFDGYYSEEMIESQVDQLVLEDLVRERFPKLVNHLDYLGVQVAWVTGPWFLSIFVNMLPWESVLRVWDVLLFDGTREMLFRTALALMELYGPAIVTTKDAGDAVTLLQSLAGSTFDSSQLVLTACMGYQPINEVRLQDLRNKHRPSVIAAMEERSKGLRVWRDSKGLASKLYSFKRDNGPLVSEAKSKENVGEMNTNGDVQSMESDSAKLDGILSTLTVDAELDSLPDLKEQATWLKVELCRLLEEKRSATLRAEELETALMEMVKQDNRRILSAKVEQLEQELTELRQALADKQEQERAMLEVLMRVEQEQKVTEDARLFAEQEAANQRQAVNALQEKYEEAMSLLAQMEDRAVMAETMLEATLQYQSSQLKALSSPRTPTTDNSPVRTSQDSSQDIPPRKISLLARPFVLGWRDKNKGKQNNPEDSTDAKLNNDGEQNVQTPKRDMNGHQEPEK